MPTPTKGPRLGGGSSHERIILANLATALFEHGHITTTLAKAKRLRPPDSTRAALSMPATMTTSTTRTRTTRRPNSSDLLDRLPV